MDIRSQFRGAWRILRVITAGEEEAREDDDEHFLWFTDDTIITGNADAAWDMPYHVVAIGPPTRIDIMRSDRRKPWKEQAIVKVEGDSLQLCSSGSPDTDRPIAFESSADNRWTLYFGIRCEEPLPD
jgi:uncharacterized protein (TIGR03067 family)